MKRNAIILAAGKGTRMKSLNQEISKVGFEILGKPLINWVLDAAKPHVTGRTVVIVGFGGEHTSKLVEGKAEIAWQHEQKGTGHAIIQTAPLLEKEKGDTLILSGDVPLITEHSISGLLNLHTKEKNDLTILTAKPDNPFGYGRVLRAPNGEVTRIVEQKDLTGNEGDISEVNAGMYVVNNQKLFQELKNLKPNNKQGELYLTDIIGLFKKRGYKVGAFVLSDPDEMLGTNDRAQLAEAAELLKKRINKAHMLNGVTLEDPNNTYIGPDVTIGQDTIISPNTTILGNSTIGVANEIGPNTYLKNMKIGDYNSIIYSYLVDSEIIELYTIGPFARMRQKALVKDGSHIGNFVELKNTTFHEGVKAGHLAYMGDAELGAHTNVGAGAITANYDGVNKSKTKVGENVFIGTNTTLVAPLQIGEGSYLAAASIINKDVPKDTLAIARSRQENKEGYAKIIREKQKKK